MSATFVTIQLDPGHRNYVPGETLAGRFRWDVVHPDKVHSVELSILWYTEGKGDEDFGVHYFEEHRLADQPNGRAAWRPFATRLPRSPLSYDGQLVKVRWCVRVRVFLEGGKEAVGEKIFRLGNVQKMAAPIAHEESKPASTVVQRSLSDSSLETSDW
jgi:hypothetical protein